ncbi:MAG TPA: DUF2510 domain-containing protein [Thermoleophilaceae bacterium]|nr:DUF2510 domain-containing protein [Thermoleophilaceae bacterium]
MAEGPGWHPDPWNAAQQRWWDGQQWTEHVQGSAAPPPPPARRRRGPVIALVAGAAIFAVLALALIVFVAAGASGDKTFEEPEFSIRFDYPSGFSRRDVPEGNSDEKISLAIDDKNGIAVSKYEQETSVTEANIGFTRSVLDGVVRQLSSEPAPSGKRVTVAGLPGFEYEFPIRSLSGVRSRSIFLFQGRDEYQINCQFEPGRRSTVMEACDQALDTLEVARPGR